MRLIEDYLQLRKTFPQARSHQPFKVSMSQLAEALYCGPRNAKNIMVKMSELEWISFQSGGGRGHMSELAFLIEEHELILREAEQRVRNGEVASALSLIEAHQAEPALQKSFFDWLYLYFGYHADYSINQLVETLRVPVYRPIVTLDPSRAFYALDCHLVSQVFNTLLEYDYETASIAGGISHHWESNEEATEWTFYLRKGVRFHHGRELDAEDVRYSFQRLQASPHSWIVRQIKEMIVLSKYTVQFRLEQPNHYLLHYISYVASSIVPKDIYESYFGSEPEIPVGTGPYKVAKWNKGSCLLHAFELYYHVRPHLDEVEIVVIPENTHGMIDKDHLLDVKTGEVDDGVKVGWENRENYSGINILTLNLKKSGMIQNPHFRKALVHLIDRTDMVNALGKPRIRPARSFDWDSEISNTDLNFSPDTGRSLLQRSGYKGESICLYTYDRHAPDAFWLQKQYHHYGINLEVEIIPWADMLSPDKILEADILLFEAVLSEGRIRLLDYYQSENSFIRMQLDESMTRFVDEYLGKFVQTANEGQRIDCLRAIEQRLKQENAIIFLTYKSVSSAAHPSLQNVTIHPRGWVDFKQLWLNNSISK